MRTTLMYRYVEEYHRAKAMSKPKTTDIPTDVILKAITKKNDKK